MIHDFRYDQASAPRRGSERFEAGGERPCGGGIQRISQVTELRHGSAARVVTRRRYSEINCSRQCPRERSKLHPRETIEAREAGENIADAAQSQPGLGRIAGKPSAADA